MKAGVYTADGDIYIEATGVDALISTYQDLGKIHSRMVVVGVHANPVPEDVRTVMDIMESKAFDIESVITHEFPQDRIVEAITTAGGTHNALNVVIKY